MSMHIFIEKIGPWVESKIQAKERFFPEDCPNYSMQPLTDPLQFDKPTSVAILKNFQKNVVAQNQEKFDDISINYMTKGPKNVKLKFPKVRKAATLNNTIKTKKINNLL